MSFGNNSSDDYYRATNREAEATSDHKSRSLAKLLLVDIVTILPLCTNELASHLRTKLPEQYTRPQGKIDA